MSLLIVGGIVLLTLLTNVGARRDTDLLIARLTGEARMPSQAVLPTLLPAQAIQSTPTLTIREGGFSLSADIPDSPLIADERYKFRITITTIDAAFKDRRLVFTVFGGGHVDPPEIRLLGRDEQVTVDYYAGSSASDVRIEATVVDENVEYTQSLTFTLESEAVQLSGMVLQPLTPAPHVPIQLAMSNSSGEAVLGDYNLRIFSNRGQFSLAESGNGINPIDLLLQNDETTDAEQTIYFIPPNSAQPAIMQVQVLGRPDIAPFETEFFWTNITARLDFLRNGQPLSGLSPEERIVSWVDGNFVCLYTYDGFGRLITPNVLNLRYEVLSGFNRTFLRSASRVLDSNQTYSSRRAGFQFSNQNSAICIPFSLQGDEGGLVRFFTWADRVDLLSEALGLVHFGFIDVAHIPNRMQVSLARQSGGSAQLNFTRADAPQLYAIRQDERQTVMLGFWVESQYVDPSTGDLRTDQTTLPILTRVGSRSFPLSLEDFAPLSQVYVAPDLSITVDGKAYFRAYAVANAAPGVFPLPPTETPSIFVTDTPIVTPNFAPTWTPNLSQPTQPTLQTVESTRTLQTPTEIPPPTQTPVPPTEVPPPTQTPVPPTEVPPPTQIPVPPTEVPPPTQTPAAPTEAPQPTPDESGEGSPPADG